MSLDKLYNQVEHMIAVSVLDALLGAGYEVAIDNGEPGDETTGGNDDFYLLWTKDRAKLLANMSLTDDEKLFVRKRGRRPWGWVRLIYGNGVDLVSDYTTNLEKVMLPLSDMWDSGGKPIPPPVIDAWLLAQKVRPLLGLPPDATGDDIFAKLEKAQRSVEDLVAVCFHHLPARGMDQGQLEEVLRSINGRARY